MRNIPIEIETLNQRLIDFYGRADNNLANFRVAWSEDQFEVRYGTYQKFTEHGVWAGEETGFKRVPKYSQWLPNQWVLERLTPVPDGSELTEKLSYEPIFPFRGLEPDWEVIKIVVDGIIQALENFRNGVRKPVEHIPEEELGTKEAQEARIDKLQKYLFEDETNLTARLHHREAVTVPDMGVKDNG